MLYFFGVLKRGLESLRVTPLSFMPTSVISGKEAAKSGARKIKRRRKALVIILCQFFHELLYAHYFVDTITI